MIAGIDVEFLAHSDDTSVEVAVRAIRQIWPDAVFADAFTGRRYDTFWDIPFGQTEELFVYRDHAAADAWNSESAVPATYNTMVHVIRDPGFITVVIDRRDQITDAITEAVGSALGSDIFVVPATLAA